MIRLLSIALVLLALAAVWSPLRAGEPVVKAAVLKFGTVNWLLDVVSHNKLDAAEGYRLEQIELARKDATSVALLAGEVDTIVTDWLWAMRQRRLGEKLLFHPYSTALGSLLVKPDGGIAGLAGLKGRKIGVAGGPFDKSWLLLRALGKQKGIGDLAETAEPVYGAAPLLAQQMQAGELDAVLIYWHYGARLEAAGLRRLIGVDEIMRALGIAEPLPLVGFVFREPGDAGRRARLAAFIRSIATASGLLAGSDAEWDRIRPRMRVSSDREFVNLREAFRAGQMTAWTAATTQAAERLFATLAGTGGERVVGAGVAFDGAVFAPLPSD